ncbi:MAG: RimK/LysX family protein, partial [Pseudomonadota bacterium]
MLVIGWQERVDLPLLGLTNLKAKIDTGARTSALHATEIAEFERDGNPWVRFHTVFDDDSQDTDVECPVHDRRAITNT